MATTGQKLPTAAQSIAEGNWADDAWVNPTNIYGAGDASVTATTFDAGDQTYVLKAYGFDFSSIPDAATIDGVIVTINARYATTAVSIDLCQLLDTSRAKVGTNKCSTPQALTTSAADYTFGTSSDKWGNTLTPVWLKDPDFGVAIGCLAGGSGNTNNDVYIDSVKIEVYYTTPSSVKIFDTFTAANGTAISGRTPEITVSGRTWATGRFFNNGAPTGTVDIQSNKASIQMTDEGFSIDCGVNDYRIVWYITTPASGQFRGGCRFRMQYGLPFSGGSGTGENDYYFATIRFDLTTVTIRMLKVVDGVETYFGTDVDMTFTASTTYKIRLDVIGTTYDFYVDDVLKKTVTDSTYSTGTKVGFGSGAVSGQNFTFDSVEIVDLSTSVAKGALAAKATSFVGLGGF